MNASRVTTAVAMKFLGVHAPDCRAMAEVRRGGWDTPWYFTGKFENRDTLGRRNHGYTRWHIVACNATNCTASVLIREDWLLKGIPHE